MNVVEARERMCPFRDKNCVADKCMFWYRRWMSRSNEGKCVVPNEM